MPFMVSNEEQPLLPESATKERRGSQERQEEPAVFKGRFGLFLSCIGCVVGTGNIWRFPRIVANNSGEKGGLQFLLVWIVFLLLWSIPVLLIEYCVGRFTKKAPIGSFRSLLGPWFSCCGAWQTSLTILIGSYYSVICGWCLYYFFHSVVYTLPPSRNESEDIWSYLQDNKWLPVLLHFVSLSLCGLTISKGVSSIERVNSVIVPLLLLLVVFSFYWSLALKYSSHGISYLFAPDWAELKRSKLWVDAAAQNAFDTGAGVGLILTYATYMTRRNSVVKMGILIPICNNIISLLCAITLYCTVFSIEMKENHNQTEIARFLREGGHANTGLTFVWIPVLFQTLGWPGRFLACLFFLCLFLGAISSLVSIMELPVKTLIDMNMPRKYALPIVFLVMFCTGIPSALDLDFLVNQDFVWSFGELLAGAAMLALPIFYGTARFRAQLVNQFGLDDWKLPKLWEYIVKILDPLIMIALIVSFSVDTVRDETNKWYNFESQSLITCLVEWFVLLTLILVVAVVWMVRRKSKMVIHRVSNQPDTQQTVFTEVD